MATELFIEYAVSGANGYERKARGFDVGDCLAEGADRESLRETKGEHIVRDEPAFIEFLGGWYSDDARAA